MTRPRPVRTKSDLADLLRFAAPTAACERCIREHKFVILGGFTPAGGLSQWLIKVTSDFNTVWYLGTTIDETKPYPFKPVRYDKEEDVPWAYWDGEMGETRLLIDGEVPTECSIRRAKAQYELRNGPPLILWTKTETDQAND